MISLRQHIFSLVAVFVALAIGIAAGSTVVRGPLLDSLRARLESAEESIQVERAENDVLAAEVAQLDPWVEDGPDQLLAGRLPDTAVLLVVAGDVDQDAVTGMIRALRASAARLVGEVRIDPAVFDPDQRERLQEVVGAIAGRSLAGTDGDEGDDAGEDPAVALGEVVAERILRTRDVVVAGGVRSDQVVRSAFGDLEDAGLVDLLQLSAAEAPVGSFDLMVMTDRNARFDPARTLDQVIAVHDPATGATGDDAEEGAQEGSAEEADGRSGAITVLVAEVGRVLPTNGDPAPSYVGAIRANGRLRDEVNTVDNAETILGWIAAVLGLESAEPGSADHYGFRQGADRPIPTRTS